TRRPPVPAGGTLHAAGRQRPGQCPALPQFAGHAGRGTTSYGGPAVARGSLCADNSALAVDSVLQTITDQARRIIGARHAFTTLLAKGSWSRSVTCVSAADGEPAFEFPQASSEMFMLACTLGKPVRLTTSNESNRPWRAIPKNHEAARRGWLAAPLLTRDGRNLRLTQLTGKLQGD